MVGPARFELAASSSRTRRSTKLSHGPTVDDGRQHWCMLAEGVFISHGLRFVARR